MVSKVLTYHQSHSQDKKITLQDLINTMEQLSSSPKRLSNNAGELFLNGKVDASSLLAAQAAMRQQRPLQQDDQQQQLLTSRRFLQQQQQQDSALLQAANPNFIKNSGLDYGQSNLLAKGAKQNTTQTSLEALHRQNLQAAALYQQLQVVPSSNCRMMVSSMMNDPLSNGKSFMEQQEAREQVPAFLAEIQQQYPFYNESPDLRGSEEGETMSTAVGNDGDENKNHNEEIFEPFPQKLYRVILEAEKNNNEDVISFAPHGRAFAIHKPRKFIAEFMPKYFNTCRMASLQRQLNLYGFRRITEGSDMGGYYHPFFLKGRASLCKKIKRKKYNNSKNVKIRPASMRALEPNFYSMPPVLDGHPAAPGTSSATLGGNGAIGLTSILNNESALMSLRNEAAILEQLARTRQQQYQDQQQQQGASFNPFASINRGN